MQSMANTHFTIKSTSASICTQADKIRFARFLAILIPSRISPWLDILLGWLTNPEEQILFSNCINMHFCKILQYFMAFLQKSINSIIHGPDQNALAAKNPML
jgi:hypothetical protein